MKKDHKVKFPYQVVIVDILIFLIMIAANVFAVLFNTLTTQQGNENMALGLSIPLFIVIAVAADFYLFVEYKFNRLKLNKIFIAIGVAIAISNLISVLILPGHLVLPNDQTYDITTGERVYAILWGFVLAFLPYLFVVLFPRRVNSRGYINLMLKAFMIFLAVLILVSFVLDREAYAHIFQNGLIHIDYEDGIKSFLGHHNAFGSMMLFGIMVSISLHIRKRNWKWSLCLIPLAFFLYLSTSKICIFLGLLLILVHLIVRIVILAKKNRDNLIITILISSLVVLLIIYASVMMSFANAGILYDIKSFLIKTFESASKTLTSRTVIWECSFKILNTNCWSYVFGYGGLIFTNALCLVYGHNPGISEQNIYWTHNGFIELLCQGGAILLLIYVALYVYLVYMSVKLIKKQPMFASFSILFIFAFIVRSMFETSFFFSYGDIFATLAIAYPVINEYRLVYKQEQDLREDLVKQSKKIKNVNFKSKILTFNKKALLLEAKYIAYDLNAKARLYR